MATVDIEMPPFWEETQLTGPWQEFLHLKRKLAAQRLAHVKRRKSRVSSDEVAREMAAGGDSIEDIAAHFSTSRRTMGKYCRAWGIAARNLKPWIVSSAPPLENMRKCAKLDDPLPILEELPPPAPLLVIPTALAPLYLRLAPYDPLAWITLQKAGVGVLPPPPGAVADAQTTEDGPDDWLELRNNQP